MNKSKVKTTKFVFKKPKFKTLDISKSIVSDTDNDGIPDYLDCAPLNPKKQGLGHFISGYHTF